MYLRDIFLVIKRVIKPETVKIVYKALHNVALLYVKELFHKLLDIHSMELVYTVESQRASTFFAIKRNLFKIVRQ